MHSRELNDLPGSSRNREREREGDVLASSFLKMLSSSMLSRGSTHLVAIADLDSIICVCCIVRARRDIVIIQFITDSWSDDDWLDKEERSSSFDWRLYDALSLHVYIFRRAD